MDAMLHDTEVVHYPDSVENSETDLLNGYDTEVVPDSDDEIVDSIESKGFSNRNVSFIERLTADLHKVDARSHTLCTKLDQSNTDIDTSGDEGHASCMATDMIVSQGNGISPIFVHSNMPTELGLQDKKMPIEKDPRQADSCDIKCSDNVKQMSTESKVGNNGKLSQSNTREVRVVYTRKTNRLCKPEDNREENVKRLTDDSKDYGGLSYVESQEPEDVSTALLFVDQYLCVNSMGIPSSPVAAVITKQKSPPGLSAKGAQSLVRWTGFRNSEKKAGVFEWNDSLDGDGGCIPTDNRGQPQLAFRGKTYTHTYVRRSPSVMNSVLTEEVHKKEDREDSERELDQQIAEESLLNKTENNETPEDCEPFCDVGIDTQIAAEAIQALSSAVSADCSKMDINQCVENLPEKSGEDSLKQTHAGVWSFPRKTRSAYSVSLGPKSSISSHHPVHITQASKKVARKNRGKSGAAKRLVGRSFADSDKAKLAKKANLKSSSLNGSLSVEDMPVCKVKNRRNVKNTHPGIANLKSSSLLNMHGGLVSESMSKRVALSAENVDHSKNFDDTSLNTKELQSIDEDTKYSVVDDPAFDMLVQKKRHQEDCLHNVGKEGSTVVSLERNLVGSTQWGLGDYPRGKRICRSLLDHSESYPLRCQLNAESCSGSSASDSGIKRKRRSTIYISPCLLSSKKSERILLGHPISELKKNVSVRDNGSNAKKKNMSSEQLTKSRITVQASIGDGTGCKANESRNSNDAAPSQASRSEQHDKKKPSPTALTRELLRLGFRESMPEFTSKTSRRRKTMADLCVLLSQSLDETIRKQQMKILMRFGVPIASCPSDATHFVTDRFARTRNMLETIAQGKPVVTHRWLESCDQAGLYIDERDYIVRDAKKEQEFGFRLPISLDRARQRPLLGGYSVLITPNAKPGKEILAGLVKVVHGKVANVAMDIELGNLLILSCDEDQAFCIPFLQRGAEAYDPELLLNGIIIQKLEFARHKLFTA